MTEFLKMDIFFVVATVAAIVVTVLTAIVLWRLAHLLKNLERISKEVAIETDIVRQDIAEVRRNIRQGKGRLTSLFGFLKTITKHRSKKS